MSHPQLKKSKYSEGVYFLDDQEWKVRTARISEDIALIRVTSSHDISVLSCPKWFQSDLNQLQTVSVLIE